MKLSIGEKIALLRKEKNVTQTQLAEYLSLVPQAVSRWEVGDGAPEISLLPKIAAFFGVSIDDLFGVTSLARAEDRVCKYSVLRDDRSFREAMEYLNAQLQTIDAARKNGGADDTEQESDRDRLEAEKLHMWIQQGREAFSRAYAIADAFVEKTEGKPDHPWYLRMRLQRNQLSVPMGKGREALAACQKDFAENPSVTTLHLYLSLLNDLDRYEDILSIRETESQIQDIILPPSRENLGIWWLLIHAAAETAGIDFIETHIPQILEVCTERDEFELLMCLPGLYRKENQEEKLTAVKNRLLALLPRQPMNQYFLERAKTTIEQR